MSDIKIQKKNNKGELTMKRIDEIDKKFNLLEFQKDNLDELHGYIDSFDIAYNRFKERIQDATDELNRNKRGLERALVLYKEKLKKFDSEYNITIEQYEAEKL